MKSNRTLNQLHHHHKQRLQLWDKP